MAHCVQKNAGGALNRGTYYYNDNGVLKTPSEAFYNIGGNVIKFPQLSKCVFNLDALTWLGGNSIYNSNTYIDKDLYNYTVTNGEGTGTVLPDIITRYIRMDQGSVNDTYPDFITPRYRFLGMSRREYNKTFTLKQGTFGTNGNITFHIKIKADAKPDSSWWNPIIFKNNWAARLEIGTNTLTDFNFYTDGNQAVPQILGKWTNGDITQNAQCATVVINSDTRKVSYYINGRLMGTVDSTQAFPELDKFTIHNRRGGATYLAPIRYYSIRIWNEALTAEEVADICKIDRSYIP